jgi:hypothetical protein
MVQTVLFNDPYPSHINDRLLLSQLHLSQTRWMEGGGGLNKALCIAIELQDDFYEITVHFVEFSRQPSTTA